MVLTRKYRELEESLVSLQEALKELHELQTDVRMKCRVAVVHNKVNRLRLDMVAWAWDANHGIGYGPFDDLEQMAECLDAGVEQWAKQVPASGKLREGE